MEKEFGGANENIRVYDSIMFVPMLSAKWITLD